MSRIGMSQQQGVEPLDSAPFKVWFQYPARVGFVSSVDHPVSTVMHAHMRTSPTPFQMQNGGNQRAWRALGGQPAAATRQSSKEHCEGNRNLRHQPVCIITQHRHPFPGHTSESKADG